MSATPKPGETFNPFLLFNGAWLPNGLMERNDLSPGAKLAYARLCQFAGRDGAAYPSIATLGREIGVKERRARELVAELEKAKLIKRRPAPGRSNRFVFLWQEWIGTPRQDTAAPAGSRRPPRQDAAGEESQGRDSSPEAVPLGGQPQNHNGSLFAEQEQETNHEHASRKPRRGTLLDENWEPSAQDREFGRSLGFYDAECDRQAMRFKNYWIAKTGKDACKRDWSRTFQNWLDREANDYDRGSPGFGRSHASGGRPGPASVVDAVNRLRD